MTLNSAADSISAELEDVHAKIFGLRRHRQAPAAAADGKTGRVSCQFDHARYELVEREGDRANAVLSFKPAEDVSGLAGIIVSPSGDVLNFSTSFSNGYVTHYATIAIGPEMTADTTILAYAKDMSTVVIGANETAPFYVILPDAGRESEFVQRGQPTSIEIPDGAWKLAGCSPW